jgi:CubicO group peptidase (beta-lactamase class C family)
LVKAPGTHFSYSTESTVLATGIARDALGGPAKVHQFLQQELLDPLSMQSAFFESDTTGLPIGGAYFYASARDWSKLAQLYLYNGTLQGQAFLPRDWMAYATKRTLKSGYGAGFWLPTDAAGTLDAELPKLPAGSFAGLGYLGQLIIMIPSHDMVILRFGASTGPDGVDSQPHIQGCIHSLTKCLPHCP